MNILVDAMGGDNAPEEIVRGCVAAVNEESGFTVTLIGDETAISSILEKEKYDNSRIIIKHTTQVITNDEAPTKAIKAKPDSSLVVGFNMIKEKQGDVLISAGSSGAILASSVLILKRIKGVDRPAVGSVIPARNGIVLLMDSGFNTMCKPNNYLQFGYLGTAYMKSMFKIDNPKVGLVNIGTEDCKGPDTVKEANVLLRNSALNYVGNIETRDFFNGVADIAVTDGFTGNVILKLIEGASTFFFDEIKAVLKRNALSKAGALLMKKGLLNFKNKLDADVNGGAPVLGIDGLVIKSHGSSKARTIKYVVLRAKSLAESNMLDDLKREFSEFVDKNEC